MDGAGARLCFTYGDAVIVGVIAAEGRTPQPLLFGGSPHLSAGVYAEAGGELLTGSDAAGRAVSDGNQYVADPSRHLSSESVRFGESTMDPLDLVAASLRRIGAQAREQAGVPVAETMIVVPASWGPQRTTALRKAASRAGLSGVRVIDAAGALLRHGLADAPLPPVGAAVAVWRQAGDRFEATVLSRTAAGWERESTIDADLTDLPRAEAVRRASETLSEAVDAAEVKDRLTAVYLLAPQAVMPETVAALNGRLGVAVTPVDGGDLAAAYGGLRALEPEGRKRRQRGSRVVGHAAALVVPALASVLLFAQQMAGNFRVEATSLNPLQLVADPAAWGLAGVYATLAATAAALAISAWQSRRQPEIKAQASFVGYTLWIAAAVSVAITLMYSTLATAQFDINIGVFLRWMLLATLPVAGLVAVIGLLISRSRVAAAEWPARLRPPMDAVVIGAAGVLAINVAMYGVPSGISDWWPILERLGGAAIGVAVVFWLVRRRRSRTILAIVAGSAGAAAINVHTATALGAVLIVTVAAWWLIRAAQLVVTAMPRDTSATAVNPAASDE